MRKLFTTVCRLIGLKWCLVHERLHVHLRHQLCFEDLTLYPRRDFLILFCSME